MRRGTQGLGLGVGVEVGVEVRARARAIVGVGALWEARVREATRQHSRR